MQRHEGLGPPRLEFDPYVPFTATWRAAQELLSPPIYVTARDNRGYLELKFHPERRHLIEAVLVAAPEIRVEKKALEPNHPDDLDLIPSLVTDAPKSGEGGPLYISAYLDYLHVTFGVAQESRWVGVDPVLFGLSHEGDVVAICARWDEFERKLLTVASQPRQS